jgi:DNA-binding NtrC family response regulator
VLLATSNNKTDAARILGIDRRSLYRRLHGGDTAPAPAPAPVGADVPTGT